MSDNFLDRKLEATWAKQNLRFLSAAVTKTGRPRNEFSTEKAYIDLVLGRMVTGKLLVGPVDLHLCDAAIALAKAGVELNEYFAMIQPEVLGRSIDEDETLLAQIAIFEVDFPDWSWLMRSDEDKGYYVNLMTPDFRSWHKTDSAGQIVEQGYHGEKYEAFGGTVGEAFTAAMQCPTRQKTSVG